MTDVRTGQYAQLPNGTRLHFASAGRAGAPLMLFLHGFPEAWFEWQLQLEEFGASYYAVAPDMRGFNLSSQPVGVEQYRVKCLVEDIVQLAAHLGYEQMVLVAHDWGGGVAWNVAIFYPQLIKHLVIINSPHPYQFMRDLALSPEQQKASEYMNWLRKPGSELGLVKDDFRLLDGMFNAGGQAAAAWFDEPTRARYHEMWGRTGEDGAPAMQTAVNYYRASPLHPPEASTDAPSFSVPPEKWTVRVPTDVIWGERDVALRTGLLDGLEQVCPGVRVTRIAEGSHWVLHEQPARINSLIAEAVSR